MEGAGLSCFWASEFIGFWSIPSCSSPWRLVYCCCDYCCYCILLMLSLMPPPQPNLVRSPLPGWSATQCHCTVNVTDLNPAGGLGPQRDGAEKGTRGVLPLETLTPRRARYLLSVGCPSVELEVCKGKLKPCHAAPTGGVLFGGELAGDDSNCGQAGTSWDKLGQAGATMWRCPSPSSIAHRSSTCH